MVAFWKIVANFLAYLEGSYYLCTWFWDAPLRIWRRISSLNHSTSSIQEEASRMHFLLFFVPENIIYCKFCNLGDCKIRKNYTLGCGKIKFFPHFLAAYYKTSYLCTCQNIKEWVKMSPPQQGDFLFVVDTSFIINLIKIRVAAPHQVPETAWRIFYPF